MWAADWGFKWNGLAVNGQYFARLLNHFDADGPLPLSSTFDHGGEFSASYFVKPKKWMPYIRGSWVIGQFRNSYEYGAGVKWVYLPTDRLKWRRFSPALTLTTGQLAIGNTVGVPQMALKSLPSWSTASAATVMSGTRLTATSLTPGIGSMTSRAAFTKEICVSTA
jgi:hypothetical protein